MNMAEKRSAMKSRKSQRKTPGKVQFSEVNSEDAAQRRAALENAIRKKIETERRALQIVERLLEDDITEDFLTDCARFISPSYYKDIVEERSIIKLCGYPICHQRLENVPKQKYRISTKTNKVYDITERKCFCSNFCYRASKYYEAQIPNTPVWSREEESPPVIKLLKDGRSGSSGEEVILTDPHITMSEVEVPERRTEGSGVNGDEDGQCEQVFVSSVIMAQTPKDTEGGDVTPEKTPEMAEIDRNMDDTTEKMSRCSLNDIEKPRDPQRGQDTDARLGSEVATSPESTEVVTEVTRRAVSKSGAERLRKLLCKSKSNEATRPADVSPVIVKKSVLDVLTQTLNQWRTEDTLKYLFGTDYVVKRTEAVAAAATQEPDLDEDDLDDIEDSSSSVNESLPYENHNRVSNPLPDYAKLRKETNMQETRVREFFGGRYALPEEAGHEPGERQEKKEVTSWAPPLPLVDSCSQQQVRRRIVLEKLKKVLPAILMTLQISYSDVSKELHDLVQTFRFTNTNIIHTVPEWSIIAIVLLSVLLPTMPLHKDSEQNPLYTQFVSKLLEELHFHKEDLECLKRDFGSQTLSLSP